MALQPQDSYVVSLCAAEGKTHVNEVLMEAFSQVVQEGTLTGVGVQQNKILDANPIPGGQRTLHVPQDPVTALLQALCPMRDGVSDTSQRLTGPQQQDIMT